MTFCHPWVLGRLGWPASLHEATDWRIEQRADGDAQLARERDKAHDGQILGATLKPLGVLEAELQVLGEFFLGPTLRTAQLGDAPTEVAQNSLGIGPRHAQGDRRRAPPITPTSELPLPGTLRGLGGSDAAGHEPVRA